MLNLAKGLCAATLPDRSDPSLGLLPGVFDGGKLSGDYVPLTAKQAPFIRTNGDWEMWMNLCSVFNRPVVRIYGVKKLGSDDSSAQGYLKAIYYADDGSANPPYRFPADAPVWDHNMQSQVGLSPNNYYPACFQDPTALLPGEGPIDLPGAGALASFLDAFQMPRCPKEFLAHADLVMWQDRPSSDVNVATQTDNMREWALQGAINAGMSVYSYLQKADLSHNTIQPYYNECQRLP